MEAFILPVSGLFAIGALVKCSSGLFLSSPFQGGTVCFTGSEFPSAAASNDSFYFIHLSAILWASQ